MKIKDISHQRRIKKSFAFIPIRCDDGEYVWFEKVLRFQTCIGWKLLFGYKWETSAILPAYLEGDVRTGSYVHPLFGSQLSDWDNPSIEDIE